MNETITTIVGNVVDQPIRRKFDSGTSVTSFRVASTARRFDRVTNHWVDGDSLYLKVTCWRSLAENTEACVVKGDPVVVTGRLYTRPYEVAESRRVSYELEATAIGFDLNRGRASFTRVSSSRAVTFDEAGPDGLPTGSAVDAHIESGMSAEDDAEVEANPFHHEPAEDSSAPAFSDATPDDRSSGRSLPATIEAGQAPAAPADVPGSGDAMGAASAAAAQRDEEVGEAAAVGRASVTPPPPGRRRGASPVPA